MKDLFSNQASVYASFRPTYPQELFDYILSFVNKKDRAWDCGTGNGQAAVELAKYFREVEATDISSQQIAKARKESNIHYRVASAENSGIADNSINLVTVATAYHWFNWSAFREEVLRVCTDDAIIAIWGYRIPIFDDEAVNRTVTEIYSGLTGPYWDPERKHIDNAYADVDFDYQLLPTREFEINMLWKREQLEGYMSTWSSVQNYQRQKNEDPLPLIHEMLSKTWPDDKVLTVTFSIFLKIGKVN